MDDLDYVIERLKADGKDRWPEVAEKTGVSVHTLIKVARGQTINPRFRTIEPVSKYYRALESA